VGGASQVIFRMFHSSADNVTSRVAWMFRGGHTCEADGLGSIPRRGIKFCICFCVFVGFFVLRLSRPQIL